MKVLSLVTTPGSAHYQQRVDRLSEEGVTHDTVSTAVSDQDNNLLSSSLPPNLSRVVSTPERVSRFYGETLKKSISNDYDVVQVSSGRIAPFALLQPTRPVVLLFWGSDILGDSFWGHNIEVARLCSKFADATIVRNEKMQNKLNHNAYIIPHGVDTELFRPMEKKKAMSQIPWEDNKKHVLFPYDPSREVKRYPVAKRVVNKVNERISPEVELNIVQGESHSKIPVYLNAADALILTSKHEGSPNTIKEAMACNCPVVSTDVGDTKTHLKQVKNSHVCMTEEGLVEKLTEVLLTGDRSNGRDMTKGLSLDKMAERYLDVYNSITE